MIQDVGEDGETLLLGSTRDGQMNLYGHDLASGETAELTDYDRAVHTGILSPDGSQLAYTTNETDDFDNMDVYVSDADGSNPESLEIGVTGAEAAPVDWGADGDRLLVTDNSDDLSRSGVYDLETDEVTWFGGEFEEEPQALLPDGERFLAVRTREATKVPVVYGIESGEERELDLPEALPPSA